MTMRATPRRLLLLQCAATDRTWRWLDDRWVGKCLHCNRKISLSGDGVSEGNATLEHIMPRNHGGTDDLSNLGIACARCNNQKGKRIDCLPVSDARFQTMIQRLFERKEARLHPPDERLRHCFR